MNLFINDYRFTRHRKIDNMIIINVNKNYDYHIGLINEKN